MKVFIDAGAFSGDTIKRFVQSTEFAPDFAIHAFEPYMGYSDNKIKRHAPTITTLHREAVWIEDGEIKFYVNPHVKKSEGSSVIPSKTSGGLDKSNPLTVKCIDFGAWMLRMFKPEDYIILKMDIEGAEYDVLKHMMADGSINLVDLLYLETHWDRIGLPKQEDSILKEQLRTIPGLKFIDMDYSHFG